MAIQLAVVKILKFYNIVDRYLFIFSKPIIDTKSYQKVSRTAESESEIENGW